MLRHTDARLLKMYLSVHPFYREIAAATAEDATLSQIHSCLRSSWPTHARGDVATYWPVRHELRTLGPFVLFQDRLCVPKKLQRQALQFLHEGHPSAGVVHMQQRARQLLFWPRITRDIYDFVLECIPCASVAAARPKEPLLPTSSPHGPGDHVAADFAVFLGRRYPILYDLFSTFPFLFPVRAESSSELLRATYHVFLQTGLPTVFSSDNGGAFISADFQQFLRTSGTVHRASSPRNPQSNGAAERAVQLIKRMLARCADEQALFRALLLLQNTRRPDLGASLSEVFFGRSQRTPITPLPAQFSGSWEMHRQRLEHRRTQQAKSYNLHARTFDRDLSGCQAMLRDFVGPAVVVTVLSPAPAPRAYFVHLPSGTVTIRNQKFLRPMPRFVPGPVPPALTSSDPGPRQAAPGPAFVTGSAGRNMLSPYNLLDPAPSTAPTPVTCFHRLPTSVHPSPTRLPSTSAPGSTASPHPSPATASRLSSVLGSAAGSSDTWGSAHSGPSLSASPPRPVSPVAVPRSPLGHTRTGRMVFPSLREQESASTGQWNPWSVITQPPPAAPRMLPPPPGLPAPAPPSQPPPPSGTT